MNNKLDHTIVRSVIGSNIRALRKARKENVTEFARLAGVDRPYMSRIEHGEVNLTIDYLVRIANGLDVPITSLFAGLEIGAPYSLPDNPRYFLIGIPEEDDPDDKD